jgi:hypothetical protein
VSFEWVIVVGVKIYKVVGFFMLNSYSCASEMVHHPKDIQLT